MVRRTRLTAKLLYDQDTLQSFFSPLSGGHVGTPESDPYDDPQPYPEKDE